MRPAVGWQALTLNGLLRHGENVHLAKRNSNQSVEKSLLDGCDLLGNRAPHI